MSPDSNLFPEEKLPGKVGDGVAITGWAAALGARRVLSEEVDRAFGMPIGKLRTRAGIESVSYAAENETEVTLGAQALQQAFGVAGCKANDIDWLIASSETHVEYPSLAAQLHKRTKTREKCGVLDAGGACLGLLNALAVAQSFLDSGRAGKVAVVTADVHSRTLVPGRVAGEFGGLFGDGASAFVLRNDSKVGKSSGYFLGRFVFGCANQYADAICVAGGENGGLTVRFDGEALSRAAITRMKRMLTEVEKTSGIPRQKVGAFATHQPNPRLVTLLAKQCNVPVEVFPEVARKSGNLGSSTCGVALTVALESAAKTPASTRKPIFLASLGPGLLYGGGWLTPSASVDLAL
jgi:3-oxoacyl-[acyl-carrier-protein] synthase III